MNQPADAMINAFNHLTIAVSDLDRAFDFYVSLLKFTPHAKWDKGAYLSVGDLWLCLSLDPKVTPRTDYTHFAFSARQGSFEAICQTLLTAGVQCWKENHSEGDSFYFLDPDGHKLELHVGTLQSRLESLKAMPYSGLILF